VFTYDLNGNLLSSTGNSLAYDFENHPTVANGIGMAYDGTGTRVREGNTVFVSNLFEKDTATGVVTDYIFFNDSMVARRRTGVISYYHGDKLGSVDTVTGNAGAILVQKTYAPFGKVVLQIGTLADSFGLAGQRLDPTGLYHMGAREMAPGLGIFVTPDPSDAPNPERPQTLNRYAYADNSPTYLMDPTGFATLAPDPSMTCNGQPQIREGTIGPLSLGDAVRSNFDRNVNRVPLISDGGRQILNLVLKPGSDAIADALDGHYVKASIYAAISLVPILRPLRAETGIAENVAAGSAPLRFTQTTASPWFSHDGDFAGQTISDVAAQLRAGTLTAADVPIQTVGNGIVNTRSSLALMQAGIPQSEWTLVNMTGNAQVRNEIATRLAKNGLGSTGTDVIRVTGSGSKASTLIGAGNIPQPQP
jgi:RHS repeat-associated protein